MSTCARRFHNYSSLKVMFSSSYYALVAGFREYALDAETKGFDIEAILAEVMEVLSSSDKKAVELLYAYYDCENLISRRNGSSKYNTLGRLSSEELDEELRQPSHLAEPIAKVTASPVGHCIPGQAINPVIICLRTGFISSHFVNTRRKLRTVDLAVNVHI